MPSSHLILSHPLLLPSIFPSIRVFSSESTLCMRWPKYIGVSALASFLPKNTQDWFPLEWTGWISLKSKGLSRVLLHSFPRAMQICLLGFLSVLLRCIYPLLLIDLLWPPARWMIIGWEKDFTFTQVSTKSFDNSLNHILAQSLLKLMSIESVMPSNHLVLCHPLLLPSIFPSIRVFSNGFSFGFSH